MKSSKPSPLTSPAEATLKPAVPNSLAPWRAKPADPSAERSMMVGISDILFVRAKFGDAHSLSCVRTQGRCRNIPDLRHDLGNIVDHNLFMIGAPLRRRI